MRCLRASIRSVLTGIALTAAFMCRASMQITGRPAAAKPSHSQGANGPASMPTRSKVSPVALRNAAMASGSLAALPSRTIRRPSSTMQIAVSFIATSRPT
jgi:hypothetical protein